MHVSEVVTKILGDSYCIFCSCKDAHVCPNGFVQTLLLSHFASQEDKGNHINPT